MTTITDIQDKVTVVVTKDELLEVLMNQTRPTFINLEYQVKVRMNKRNNPYYDKVLNTSRGNFFICGTYEDMVRLREGKEGLEPIFVSEPNKVGNHVTKCILFNENTQKYYLQCFLVPNSIHTQEFEFEGRNIKRELFKSFEVKKSKSSRQVQNKKVFPFSITLDNIKELSLNKVRYIVE